MIKIYEMTKIIEQEIVHVEQPKQPCMNPGHKPCLLLYVPPGQKVDIVCPGCGQRTEIHGSNVTF